MRMMMTMPVETLAFIIEKARELDAVAEDLDEAEVFGNFSDDAGEDEFGREDGG